MSKYASVAILAAGFIFVTAINWLFYLAGEPRTVWLVDKLSWRFQ